MGTGVWRRIGIRRWALSGWSLFLGGTSATGFAPLSLWPVTLAAFAFLIGQLDRQSSGWSVFRSAWLFAFGHFAVGLVASLDWHDPAFDLFAELQNYKKHPLVQKYIRGGEVLSYGAKTIPEGGYFSVPRVYTDGALLVGDSAGLVDVKRNKGIPHAMKSGMLAAEAAFHALLNESYSAAQLSEYHVLFENSWAKEELWSQRNFHQAFEHGQIAGIANAGLSMITGGRGFGFVNRLDGKAGHEQMERIQRYFGSEDPHPPEKMKFDNSYTFDKVSDVYYGGVVHEENQPPHLLIRDTEVCITRCTAEYGNPCLHFCPAHVYEPQPTADGRGKVPFLNFTNCFHCKTCDIMDPYGVITWVPPEGGGGPQYDGM